MTFGVLAFSMPLRARSQQVAGAAPSASELQPAAAAFASSQWKAAYEAYLDLAKKYPTHALSRFRVGVALVELGRFSEGETNLREGEHLGMPPGIAGYRLAQALAEQKKSDAAIAELQRAAAAGATLTPSSLDADSHLASLHGHPKWASVLDTFDALIRPCMHDPRFREFDFWVGDWDVRPTGTPAVGPAARNTVTIEDNGCVVMEHWKAPSGSEGQSFNIFDRSVGLWRQTWVDNVGGQHDYRGQRVGRDMAFQGDTPAPNGGPGRVPTKLTFFSLGPDSVRQFSQTSADSGKTWQTAYDLMYVRRKP